MIPISPHIFWTIVSMLFYLLSKYFLTRDVGNKLRTGEKRQKNNRVLTIEVRASHVTVCTWKQQQLIKACSMGWWNWEINPLIRTEEPYSVQLAPVGARVSQNIITLLKSFLTSLLGLLLYPSAHLSEHNFRHISFHFPRPNSEQMNLVHWVTTYVQVKVGVSKGDAEERTKCHFWGYRTSWVPLNQTHLQLMGRITEQPIALSGLLWTWSLWCILITNNWHKLNLVPSQQLWQEHFGLVHSHENIIANLWGLSAVWHRNVVLANGHGDTQWGEVKGISGFIWAQGLKNTTLCFGQSNSEGKRRVHKFITPRILLQKLSVGLILQLWINLPSSWIMINFYSS